jgi:hypothetical protein
MISTSNKTLIMIDGDNLLMAAKQLNINIDFGRLRQLLQQRYPVVPWLRFYVSCSLLTSKRQAFLRSLLQFGYYIHVEDDQTIKSSIDMVMVTDTLSLSGVFETAQALISRFDKLWTEGCVPGCTDVRVVRIIWGLLSGRRWNKHVVHHAVNQLL